MPRQLALFLCVAFILWLFRTDIKWRKMSSPALWIPAIWLAIIGSRPVGCWLGGGLSTSAVQGNLYNLLIQGSLMVASLLVLQRRTFDWRTFVKDNKALVALYSYFALTALWSYFPFVSLKRVGRDFGTVLMVLVILTETNPFAAARLLFVRVAYLLFPLSVLFIKYFPQYGRMYGKNWEPMWTGVTMHKNALGLMVLVFGLFLVFDLMELHRNKEVRSRKKVLVSHYLMFLMGGWLLVTSNSKTSLVSAILGGVVLWSSRYLAKLRNPRRIAATCVAVLLAVTAIDSTFGVSATIIHALGRKENLTGRTEVWDWVLEQPINPVVGYGFHAFWDGPLGQAYNDRTNQDFPNSQSGYLDTYVDGGMVAVLLLAWLLISNGNRILESMPSGALFPRAMFTLFAVALIHDYTETSFFILDPLWFTMVLTVVASGYYRRTVVSWEMEKAKELTSAEATELTF